jgi:hypothetical protein
MRKLKNSDNLSGTTKYSPLLQPVAVLEAILGLLSASIFAFLNLLVCLTPIRADEQMVIKDSDAI